jgi:hypothetical protein
VQQAAIAAYARTASEDEKVGGKVIS